MRSRGGASLAAYDDAEFAPPVGALLLAVVDGETVAGGALRRLADGVGEIKRMWTAPAHRRRGHSRRILTALYRSAGYVEIADYGRLGGDPRAVSFEKRLRQSAA